jgi:hypothetical protein
MNNKTWIPEPNELVRWQGKLHRVVSVDLGGKCKIKRITTTKRITKTMSNIDISELQNMNNN